MTQLDIASQDVATLETAKTLYVEGHGIRFAYRPPRPNDGNAASSPAALLGQHRCVGSRRRQRPRCRSPCDRIRQRRGRPLDRPNARQCPGDGARRGYLHQPARPFRSRPAGLFSRRFASPNRFARRAPKASPQAHPRRHRAERWGGTPVSGSAGGLLPVRCAGPSPAALLHQVVRQPISRPGIPEAGKGA